MLKLLARLARREHESNMFREQPPGHKSER
jgi:hypothetical protein